MLGTVATALNLPCCATSGSRRARSTSCWRGTCPTPTVRFIARDVKVLGKGEILLRSGTLAHEFTLLVPPEVVRRAPREIRSAFTARPDGLMGVDFRLWGPYRSPRTDLQDRVLRGFAESILRKGLKQFLR